MKASDLVSFQVRVKETDLWVSTGERLEKETRDLVLHARHQIESYISSHPDFLTTLKPYPDDPLAPPVVKEMISATRPSGVGPMASVAGAIAEFVGQGLLKSTGQVIVENGGDIFLMAKRPVTVSIFAGASPLSEKLGLLIPTGQMPLGVCTSSGTVGHSLSLGAADAACVLSASARACRRGGDCPRQQDSGQKRFGRCWGLGSRHPGGPGVPGHPGRPHDGLGRYRTGGAVS